MYKQDSAYNSEKYAVEELLSIFKAEEQPICNKPEGVLSVAKSTLCYFIKCYRKYVRLV